MTAPQRERLPAERRSITRVFRLPYTHSNGKTEIIHFYFTIGFYADGRIGEVFIKADKQGSLAAGSLDATATMISLLLQYGVPLKVILDKLKHTRYPPNGFTQDSELPSCSSALDLLAQFLELRSPPDKLPVAQFWSGKTPQTEPMRAAQGCGKHACVDPTHVATECRQLAERCGCNECLAALATLLPTTEEKP